MANLSAQSPVKKPTASQAIAYVYKVKDTFKDEMEKYYDFLKITKDFKAERIDAADVAAELTKLFEGHPNLILGLNIFLPKDHQITLPSEDEQPQQQEPAGFANISANPPPAMMTDRQPVTIDGAIAYLMTVKTILQNEMEKYHVLMEIMKEFRTERIDTADVAARVKELFEGHPDLLLGFKTFLPKDYDFEDEDTELNKPADASPKQ